MGSGVNWYQIGNKACYLLKVCKFYIEKGYLCWQAWKWLLWHVHMHFTDKNLIQKQDPMVLNVASLEMKHTNR